MVTDAGDVSNYAARFVCERQPIDKVTLLGSRALANILPTLIAELCRFETAFQKPAHNGVGKKCHSAIGMMDDKPLLRSQQLVGNHKRAYRIVAGATARITNHMGVALAQAGI